MHSKTIHTHRTVKLEGIVICKCVHNVIGYQSVVVLCFLLTVSTFFTDHLEESERALDKFINQSQVAKPTQ